MRVGRPQGCLKTEHQKCRSVSGFDRAERPLREMSILYTGLVPHQRLRYESRSIYHGHSVDILFSGKTLEAGGFTTGSKKDIATDCCRFGSPIVYNLSLDWSLPR